MPAHLHNLCESLGLNSMLRGEFWIRIPYSLAPFQSRSGIDIWFCFVARVDRIEGESWIQNRSGIDI